MSNKLNAANLCGVPGCDKKKDKGKLCSMHRTRLSRYGSINATGHKGRNQNTVVLTDEDVCAIKRMHKNFKTKLEISKAFNISTRLVKKVLDGEYKVRDK
jgi:hypothetical protein